MANEHNKSSGLRKKQWLWIGVASLIFIIGSALVWESEDTVDVTVADDSKAAPPVSVIEVEPKDSTATVTAYVELRPRWDSEIRASVSGRIEHVHEAALEGMRVDAGTVLLTIEKTQYQAALAAAELSLEQARLQQQTAEKHVSVARRQFEREGIEPPNDLALRLPQLKIAERALTAAEAQLQVVRRQLSDTDVVAPFSGYVIQRMVSPGQTISIGEALLHLSDDAHFEAVAELSPSDWDLLDHPVSGQFARLFLRNGAALGQAQIRQGGGFLDRATRQPRIFLDVNNAREELLGGDFVRVDFTGRTFTDTLTIPESALSRSGVVWMVDAEDRLARVEPDILFRSGQTLTITRSDLPGPWRVALTPLASFLPGMRVAPLPRER
ncbi:MAG: efflux RND transporter periplasmic adaptor subunit [Pseudomonadota bacterium]